MFSFHVVVSFFFGTDGDDEGLTTLYVGSLNPSVTEDQLKKIFMQYGEVQSVKVVPDKCCGFVQFVKRMNAEAAFVMDKQMVGGSRIRISWSHTQLCATRPAVVPKQPEPAQSVQTPQSSSSQQYDQFVTILTQLLFVHASLFVSL